MRDTCRPTLELSGGGAVRLDELLGRWQKDTGMQVTIDGVDYMPMPKLLMPQGTMGETLCATRKSMKLSLEAASKVIGCSKGYLWELEADRAMPGLDIAARISRAYGVPIGVLAAFTLRPNAELSRRQPAKRDDGRT